jgi:hypothetical protein
VKPDMPVDNNISDIKPAKAKKSKKEADDKTEMQQGE